MTILFMAGTFFIAWLAWGYPPAKLTVPESDIIFSHSNHGDLECLDCHSGGGTATLSQERLLPEMDICGDCHDIEDVDECETCHRNTDDPSASPNPERPIEFNHQTHFELKVKCGHCHDGVAVSEGPDQAHMPVMSLCMNCHDGMTADSDCDLCHGGKISLLDIHPPDWRHQHGEQASGDSKYCTGCHKQETACLECHRGDNLTGNIHDLNYIYTHGLDVAGNENDCARCHDRKLFCNGCHEGENRIPLLHSTLNWMSNHAEAARNDIENCASCHDSGDPTCARGGCHRDLDGIRGTDARIHPGNTTFLDSKGPWHNDDGYFCYQCHTNTRTGGVGFCGYCHGFED